MAPYAERVEPDNQGFINQNSFPSFMGVPFLVAAGYAEHPNVQGHFLRRIEILHETSLSGDYDIYVPPEQKHFVPSQWRNKPVYKAKYYEDKVPRLPMCYDLYAMANWPTHSSKEAQTIEDIISYISDPRFQNTSGGYLWSGEKREGCLAYGKRVLARMTEKRKVLLMTLMARFRECQEKQWFRDVLEDLESHRTVDGTYSFPSHYLLEKRNSYYLYEGAHMGLGENRRRRKWREVESTFRMMDIKRLMDKKSPNKPDVDDSL
jgi:hypothetical protein